MAIVTNDGHTSRAVDFHNKVFPPESTQPIMDSTICFGIGGTMPWGDPGAIPSGGDEDNPPAEIENETFGEDNSDIICFARITNCQYVKYTEDETIPSSQIIEYRGKKYKILVGDEIWSENCRHIIVEAWLNYSEAPTGVSYRKIGLFSHVEPTDTNQKNIFTPAETDMTKIKLDAVANDTATRRSASKREKLAMLIEF